MNAFSVSCITMPERPTRHGFLLCRTIRRRQLFSGEHGSEALIASMCEFIIAGMIRLNIKAILSALTQLPT